MASCRGHDLLLYATGVTFYAAVGGVYDGSDTLLGDVVHGTGVRAAA